MNPADSLKNKVNVYYSTDKKIVYIESFIIAIVLGMLAHHYLDLHPALCLVAGIIEVVLFLIAFQTTVGYWIITLLCSLFWGLLGMLLACAFSNGDAIWTWVIGAIAFLVSLSLHHLAKRFTDNVSEC